MTDDIERRSVIIDVPKPKSYIQTTNYLKSKNKYQNRAKQSVKFYDPAIRNQSLTLLKPLPSVAFKRDNVIVSQLLFSKQQEKERFTQLMKISLRDKYKIVYQELQDRLNTDEPPDDFKTITDIDAEYFTCVHGSVLNTYIAPFKSLKYMINNRLRHKQEVGYRNDCILNITLNAKKEREMYHKTMEKYKAQVKLLDEFISYDYKKSIESLNEWDLIKTTVDNIITDLKDLAAKEFTFTSNIISLDYKYSLQQKYGRFLYYLSPPSWRLRNRYFARSIEIEAKGFDFGSSSEEDKFNVIFEKIKQELCRGLVKPPLYFKLPRDLMDIFQTLETQNLHHFSHVAGRAPYIAFLKKGVKLFKDIIAQESSGIRKTIHDFEQLIYFNEEHCGQLETKFFKILNGFFYKSVGDLDVLKLQLHLEFSYEKVFNEKPINMDMISVAKALEGLYLDLNKRLDAITARDIKDALVRYEALERQKFRRANEAARELHLFGNMENALIRSYQPPAIVYLGQMRPLSLTRTMKKKLQASSKYDNHRRNLSEVQIEYLTVFTDWTEKDNPANYVHNIEENDN